jgi:hypothetical protein
MARRFDRDQSSGSRPMQDCVVKIQVQCRRGGDPRLFLVGARWLQVMRVLERAAENSMRRFRVRVADGREFVLRHDPESGDWRLAGVQPRRA